MAKAKTTALQTTTEVIQDAEVLVPVTIAGIACEVEDPHTGAPVGFHKVRSYTVDLVAKSTVATLASYISETAARAGRNPVTHTSVTIAGLPEGDVCQWVYGRILTAGNEDGKNGLAGATAVLDSEAA